MATGEPLMVARDDTETPRPLDRIDSVITAGSAPSGAGAAAAGGQGATAGATAWEVPAEERDDWVAMKRRVRRRDRERRWERLRLES